MMGDILSAVVWMAGSCGRVWAREQQHKDKDSRDDVILRESLVRREGFEPPAFWSVGCLTRKSEPFRLRFVLFATVRSAEPSIVSIQPCPFSSCSGSKVGQTRCARTRSNSVSSSIAPEATARPTSTTSSFVQSNRIPLTSRAELIYDWARKSGQKTVRTFLI